MTLLRSHRSSRVGHTALVRRILATTVCVSVLVATVATSGPRFRADDPITREPETQDASRAAETEIGLMFELSYNLFVIAHHQPSHTRAQNLNTIDDVPDSSWFTNRVGAQPLTSQQVEIGAATGAPPASERWVILGEKSSGANPGFTARDANGETWFLALDRPSNPEGPSAAVVIASRLFWALGYNQVEMFITSFDPARTTIDPQATRRRPSGDKTPFTRSDLDEVLERGARNHDGTYRVAAGRVLPGKVLGSFRYSGTRPDDPNDLVPHEHRRDLRALRVFAAWTNMTDLKAGNTLDTLVTEHGRAVVKHYLQDVGSTFGMANGPHEWDVGWEHFYEGQATRRRLLSFGLALSPWQLVPYREYPSVGRFEGDEFDPAAWRPHSPPPAYMELRADDAFWAARRVMAFDDNLIRAAVHAGQLSDPVAERHLVAVLIKRRDVVGRTYLPAINPVVDPRLDAEGRLTFANAAVAAGFATPPVAYQASWFRFDNATGETSPLGTTRSENASLGPPTNLPGAVGSFVQIDITAESADHPSWQEPVRTHFRRVGGQWQLVGLERLIDRSADSHPAVRNER